MKKKYKVENWSEYNASLKNRGSLTIWIEDNFEKTWYSSNTVINPRGRPMKYSDNSINLMITLRHLFKLPLRQVEGFVKSIFSLLKLDLEVPEFSRISKRMKSSLASIKESPYFNRESQNKSQHLVIDSTGLKVYGEQEWLETKYGKSYYRKVWKKLHIGIDGSGYIVASSLTNHRTDDRQILPDILNTAKSQMQITELLADGGYDSHKIYEICRLSKIRALIPPPRNAKVHPRKGKNYARNKTVRYIVKKGFHAWRVKNDFGRSYRAENTFYRIKTIFGRKLKSRK